MIRTHLIVPPGNSLTRSRHYACKHQCEPMHPLLFQHLSIRCHFHRVQQLILEQTNTGYCYAFRMNLKRQICVCARVCVLTCTVIRTDWSAIVEVITSCHPGNTAGVKSARFSRSFCHNLSLIVAISQCPSVIQLKKQHTPTDHSNFWAILGHSDCAARCSAVVRPLGKQTGLTTSLNDLTIHRRVLPPL